MSWNQGGGPWGPSGGDDGRQGLRPRKPKSPGGEAPELEDFIRRSQERLQSFLPGDGWNARTIALLFVAADQVGVVTRFGAYQAPPRPPGLNFMLWPVDRVQILRVTAANLEEIGF